MITAQAVELRIGARVLLHDASFRIAPGDRIGLVGRNGAGKTTLTKTLAGETQPTGGKIVRGNEIGYLPQDPRTGDLDVIAMDRVLSARGLDSVVRQMRETEGAMASLDVETHEAAMERYPRLEERFLAAGGYAAESEAETITSNLGLDDRILAQTLGTLSGGQRRRIELARILFSGVETLLLDEPTNHLDADSIIWLREYLRHYSGGLIVISHDNELLRAIANKVFHLDGNRGEIDQYNMGWDRYLEQRETDERRRRKERQIAEKTAGTLLAQAEKMRAKATKAVAAQNMIRRAEKMLSGLEGVRASDKVANLRFPKPAACGKTPLTASGLSKAYGSQEVFTGVDLAIDRGSRVVILGLNGAGKTTLLRILGGVEDADQGTVNPGHGLKIGYYAQEHETLDMDATVVENLRHAAPDLGDTEVRGVLGSFLFSGDDADKPTRVLSGGEKTRLALATLVVSSANVLLLDEPTNNLDPASRAEILGALSTYEGAVVMVTHDDGAVAALNPERVLLLPDGDEDLWNDSYAELVSLA
ncbi:ABC transporter ATP-binding protein [Paraoerskovia sediminicola]|uniref:ABC transporter ATP-binding protein n=1 Tax=Paraoerskovia sediminicola TaxID=1138587 RepID=A0ABM8G6H5_9CELL|nr:ABC-F family ATP-binding cassette domain-containing protein [Paraoerskovia sediminicola]BDZ43746.1 ABC transporter ATP-binding protein [Paraoerskovia sediminicola]